MIKFRASGALSYGEIDVLAYDVTGPHDGNGNNIPDVQVSLTVGGKVLYQGPIDFPAKEAISAIMAIFSTVAGRLPFPFPGAKAK